MKIAYVFKTDQSSTFQLNSMILPQLEQGNHMVNVIGMFSLMTTFYVFKKEMNLVNA